MLILLNGCGGGGGNTGSSGSSGNSSGTNNANTASGSYTISGTLSGLGANASVTLQDNGTDAMTLTANGKFTFATALSSGSTYRVTVSGQPSLQICYIATGTDSGVVGNANITGVLVTCQSNTPEISMTWDSPLVAPGQNATLQWTGTQVSNCTASGNWSGSQPASGTFVSSNATPGYYTDYLTCSTGSGMLTVSAVLTVYGTTNVNRVSATSQPIWYQAQLYVPSPNQIIQFDTDMIVPALPPVPSNAGAYFAVWPGLEPASNATGFNPINLGVLQPVLEDYTYQSWDGIAVYDNDNGAIPPIVSGRQNPTYAQEIDGLNSNNAAQTEFTTSPGDLIHASMVLNMSSGCWTVLINDVTQGVSNTLVMNMQGQLQNYALFDLESWYGMTIGVPVSFANTAITLLNPDTSGACSITTGQLNNYTMTPPVLDSTGTVCTIAQVTLAQN